MKVIHKYDLQIVDEQEIDMPVSSDILTIDWQGSTPVMWARVDPSAIHVKRKIFLIGTGHKVPPGLTHISTIQMQSGALVLHWFRTSV